MLNMHRGELVAFAVLLVGAFPACAKPPIEAIADALAIQPVANCVDKLPDGQCPDEPSDRQMIIPGAHGVATVSHRAMHAVARSIREDISMTFLLGSAELTADAKATLDRFAKRLLGMASYRPFTIEGHTDHRGTAESNQKLSQARADSVVTYLLVKDVDQSKMTARGYGFDKPLKGVRPDSSANRRVELVAN